MLVALVALAVSPCSAAGVALQQAGSAAVSGLARKLGELCSIPDCTILERGNW